MYSTMSSKERDQKIIQKILVFFVRIQCNEKTIAMFYGTFFLYAMLCYLNNFKNDIFTIDFDHLQFFSVFIVTNFQNTSDKRNFQLTNFESFNVNWIKKEEQRTKSITFCSPTNKQVEIKKITKRNRYVNHIFI